MNRFSESTVKVEDRCVGLLGLHRDCKCQEYNSFLLGIFRQVNMVERAAYS